NGDVFAERVTRAAVKENGLTVFLNVREPKQLLDLLLERAVEHRRRKVQALEEGPRERNHLLVGKRRELLSHRARFVDLFEASADLGRIGLAPLDHVFELTPQLQSGPTEVNLEDLPDVHAARNAKRVEDDVDGRAVR